jgi:hypothetical protein
VLSPGPPTRPIHDLFFQLPRASEVPCSCAAHPPSFALVCPVMMRLAFAVFSIIIAHSVVAAMEGMITRRQVSLKATVSIAEYTEWSYLRSCERRILSEDDWMGGEAFKCTYPFDNNCYCNTARAPIATSYISSIVYSYCKDFASDYTAVANLYSQYCSDVSAGVQPPFHATPLTDTVTVTDLSAWGSLGECGRRILSEDDWLRGEALKCPSPWYNNCYCNANLGPVATSYISSCIFTYCKTVSAEFPSVLDVYNQYCGSLGRANTQSPPATLTGSAQRKQACAS